VAEHTTKTRRSFSVPVCDGYRLDVGASVYRGQARIDVIGRGGNVQAVVGLTEPQLSELIDALVARRQVLRDQEARRG
jgi:hypothetical protein